MNAQDVDQDVAPRKAARKKSTTTPRDSDLWYERYPRRFREATSRMPFELRGAYSLLIDLYFEYGKPLPNDDKWIASGLYIDVRKWNPIRKKLFACGKLRIGADGLIHNELADELLALRKARIDADRRSPEATSGLKYQSKSPSKYQSNSGDNFEKDNDFNDGARHSNSNSNIDNGSVCGEVENPSSSVLSLSAAAAMRVKRDKYMQQLIEAAGNAVADPAGAPNLLNLSIPTWWIEQGCDVERDILPALRKIAARKPKPGARKIVSWEYFNNLVAENRDARMQGLKAKHEPSQAKQAAYYDPDVAKRYAEAQAALMKRPMVTVSRGEAA